MMQMDVASGHDHMLARGEQPAVDSTGGELAFMTGAADVEVRDLHTGTSRRLNLSAVLGFRIDPLNSQLGWLADDQTIVMLPDQPAIAAAVEATARPHRTGICRPSKTEWPIVFIHVP